jgi:Fe-Mn family superoxide dismutase
MKNLLSFIIILFFLNNFSLSQQFEIPKLNYTFNALEPTIDSVTMRIHYTKHHQAYVSNLNSAIGEKKITLEGIFNTISEFPLAVRNNAGGHFNHSLYWEILSPTPTKTPSKSLMVQIEKQFGGLDSLKQKMTQTGLSLFGSGWVWLSINDKNELFISTTQNQDNPLMNDIKLRGTPIIGIDIWEHAYYLKHQNKRKDYLRDIWNVIDWGIISQKYEQTIQKK